MCPSDTRPSESTSSDGFDVQRTDILEPMCSLSLVDAYRHASTATSVGRTEVVGEIGSGGPKKHSSVEAMLCADCYQPEILACHSFTFHFSPRACEEEGMEGS